MIFRKQKNILLLVIQNNRSSKIAGGIIIIMKIPIQRWKVAVVLGEEKFGATLYSLPSSVVL
jgi:hypothetical protein